MSLFPVAPICRGNLEPVGDLRGSATVPAVLGDEPVLVIAALEALQSLLLPPLRFIDVLKTHQHPKLWLKVVTYPPTSTCQLLACLGESSCPLCRLPNKLTL